MFPNTGENELIAVMREDGPMITHPEDAGVIPYTSTELERYYSPVNAIVRVLKAPLKLWKHLDIMREELIQSENKSEIAEIINGMSFDTYDENACVVRYLGVKLLDKQFPVGDPRRQPYNKLVEDICEQYSVPEATKTTMSNGCLAKESHQLDFEFKFSKGKPGNFYFGKYMAQNVGGGEVDLIFMCYRLGFKFTADEINHTYQIKFLGFTTGKRNKIEYKEKALTEKDKKNFEAHFRFCMFEKLGRQLKGFAEEDDVIGATQRNNQSVPYAIQSGNLNVHEGASVIIVFLAIIVAVLLAVQLFK